MNTGKLLVFRVREEGEGSEMEERELLGPQGREGSDFECRDPKSTICKDGGIYRLLGC
jgi:hypothetical protein